MKNVFRFWFAVLIICSSCNLVDKKSDKPKADLSDPKIQKLNGQIEKDPSNAELYYSRGALYFLSKNLDLAAKDLYKATRIDSTKADYFSLLADINAEARYIRQAINYYQIALRLSPDDVDLKLKLTKMFLYVKEYDAAVATLNELLSRDKYNPRALLLKGICYKERGDTVAAIRFFKDVVTQDPDHYDAWMQLGLLAREQGSPLAEKYYLNTIRIDSNRYEGNYALAMFYQENGMDEKAKKIYRQMIIRSPQTEEPIFNIAFIYYNEDSLQKAIQNFTICVQLAPDNAEAYYWRGKCYKDLKQKELAIHDFAQALELKPELLKARTELNQLGGNIKH